LKGSRLGCCFASSPSSTSLLPLLSSRSTSSSLAPSTYSPSGPLRPLVIPQTFTSVVAPGLRAVVARRTSSARRRVPARHRAATLMLVMPAIEPGWEPSLAGAAAYTDARAVLVGPFLHLLVRRSATAVPARRRGLDASALAFLRVLCESCAREPGAHPRTPPIRGKVVPLAASIDSHRRLVRRTGASPLRVPFPLLDVRAPRRACCRGQP
jgi:hypothetical protein